MQTKVIRGESDIPTHWYNIVADMPNSPAPVPGADGQPIGPDTLSAIFSDALIEQEAKRQFEKIGEYPEDAIEEALHHLPKVDIR